MKRGIPLLIVFFTGMIWLTQYFIPHYPFNKVMNLLSDWMKIIAAFAMVLGILNLLRVNFIKISRKHYNWQYSIILIIALLITIGFGCIQGITENVDTTILVYNSTSNEVISSSIFVAPAIIEGLKNFKPISSEDVEKDGKKETIQKGMMDITTKKGKVVKYTDANPVKRIIVKSDNSVIETVIVKTGTVGHWIYKNLIEHLSSTMFSLLAFFIASAAFRAFRAKSFEAMLLLGSAFIVMLGKVPIGDVFGKIEIHEKIIISFPSIQVWLMNYVNTAGQRAILLGAAIGIIAISIKIIIGLERTYFGGE